MSGNCAFETFERRLESTSSGRSNDRSAGIDVRERPGEPGMPISMGSVSAPYRERAGRPGALEPELDGPNLLPDEPKPAILELSLHRQS